MHTNLHTIALGIPYLFWGAMIAGAWLSTFVPPLRRLSQYGKLARPRSSKDAAGDAAGSTRTSVLGTLNQWTWHNSFVFTSYYVLACALNTLVLVAWCQQLYRAGDSSSSFSGGAMCQWQRDLVCASTGSGQGAGVQSRDAIDSYDALLVTVCLELHYMRRLYECIRVHHFSQTSTSTVVVAIMGQLFYAFSVVTPLFTVPFCGTCVTVASSPESRHNATAGTQWRQHESHVILSRLRDGPAKPQRMAAQGGYNIARGGWFDVVTMPHYFAEILIYCAMLLLQPVLLRGLILCFVASNLTITATRSHSWYLRNFAGYKSLGRRVIFPYVL